MFGKDRRDTLQMEQIMTWEQKAQSILSNHFEDFFAQYQALWNDFSKKEKPVVSIVGPYSAGKSSLIKRLLIQENCNIPDWLTISGRRETFELNQIELSNQILRDTPGLCSGNPSHDEITKQSVILCDQWILILPPNLLTSEGEEIGDLLTGRNLDTDHKNLFLWSNCIVAVNRMDEGGIDPDDNLEGYQELCMRKQSELTALLKKYNIPISSENIHTIASDPFGFVGNDQETTIEEYETGKNWDGFAEFTQTIQSKNSLSETRSRAQIRFLIYSLNLFHAELDKHLQEQKLIIMGIENEQDRISLLTEELNHLREYSEAKLRSSIDNFLNQNIQNITFATQDDFQKGLQKEVDRWYEEITTRIQKLLYDYETDLKLQTIHMARIEELEPKGNKENKDMFSDITKIGKMARSALKNWNEHQMGYSLDSARKELKKINEAGNLNKHLQGTPKAGIKNIDQLNQAKWAVKADIALSMLPQVIELGKLIHGVYQSKQEEIKKQAKRTELRRTLRCQAEKLANQYTMQWWEQIHPVRVSIQRTKEALHTKKGEFMSLKTQHESLEATISEVLSSIPSCT